MPKSRRGTDVLSRAGAGGERLSLTASSSHEGCEGMGGPIGGPPSSRREGRERQTVACVTRSMPGPAVELEERPYPAEPETALSRSLGELGRAGGERPARTHISCDKCGGATGRRSEPDVTGELELGALPCSAAAGIEIVELAGAERTRSAAVSEGRAGVGGEIASVEGGGTEGPGERATPRWRTAPHPAQGPPSRGTEIQAGAEPAEELPERVVLQRDE
jgi:hypothetical protein